MAFVAIPESSAMLIVTELAQCSLSSLRLQLQTREESSDSATAADEDDVEMSIGEQEMLLLVQQILDGMCYLVEDKQLLD